MTGFGSVNYAAFYAYMVPSSDDNTDDSHPSVLLSDGAIAGIVIGGVAGVSIVGAAVYFLFSSATATGTAKSAIALGHQ